MDKNYLEELILKRYNITIIKEALVLNRRNLENKAEDQRENQIVLVLMVELLVEWHKRKQFKL